MAKWIIDTDTGIQDVQGVFVALKYMDVLGITCVHGKTTVDNVATNAQIITGIKGKESIPVFKGCSRRILKRVEHVEGDSIISPPPPQLDLNGVDGLGGAQSQYSEYIKDNLQSEHAVNALVRLVNEQHDAGTDVNIVTLGPLTNLATALILDPELPSKIGKLYVSGGTYKARGNSGSGSPSQEFNFFADPEAARIVYENFPMINLLP